MGIRDKLKFIFNNKFFWYKHRLNLKIKSAFIEFKYSPFIKRFFSGLNFKAVIILLIIYILFVFVQLTIFSNLFKPPKISDLPKVRNYLSSYIYSHKLLSQEINNRVSDYFFKCELFAKKYSVPFYLNHILDMQKSLNRYSKNWEDIENFFIFNHLGRLLNITPWNKKYWRTIYTYTPYMKWLEENIPQKAVLYFYLDNPYILSKYNLKKNTYISRHKLYNMEPFQVLDNFADTKKEYVHKFLDEENIFPDIGYKQFQDSEVPYIIFFTPLYNQIGKFIGVAGFTIKIDSLFKDIMKEYNELFSTVVVNNKGLLVYTPDKEHIGEYVGDFDIMRKILKSDSDLIIKSRKEIYLKEKMDNKDWYIVSMANPNKVLFKYKRNPNFLFTLIIFFLFEAIVFFILFLLFKKYITGSLNRISYGIKNLLHGRPDTEVTLNSSTEFKMIENRFNRLVSKVGGFLVFGKTVPEEMVNEYINNQFNKIVPDMKQGSALYLKIKNISEIQSSNSKEELEMLLNKFMNDIEVIVSKHRGYIDYFAADSFLAVFGVPFNHYDHIKNSVNAASNIFRELRKFNKRNNSNIEISISINTGNISYSQLRSNYGKFFIVVGDTIRDAYSFESITKPGVLVISEAVFKHLKNKIKVHYVVDVKIRGRDMPEKVYAVKFKL